MSKLYDLTGKKVGEWTVLKRVANRRTSAYWQCVCSCGKVREIRGCLLANNKTFNCGHADMQSLVGKKFGRWIVISFAGYRENKSHKTAMWNCICECGTQKSVDRQNLLSGISKSCGCLSREAAASSMKTISTKKEFTAKANDIRQERYARDGTRIDIIRREKMLKNNTSGVKGVYKFKGKWIAKIGFKGKQIFLGAYTRIEDAAAARKHAEEIYFKPEIEKWEKEHKEDEE